MKSRLLILLFLAPLIAGFVSLAARAADVPNIAVAANLKFAMEELAQSYTRATGNQLKLSFASSGVFQRQIAEGAPFELFLSADQSAVEALHQGGRTEDAGMDYAIGRLVLYVPKGSPIKADPALRDLIAASKDGRLQHLAIANPEHAPYGRAAREVLQHAGIWNALNGKLVMGENVAQAARYATTLSAQAALLPYALAIAPELAAQGDYLILPDSWYAPLKQRMVLIKGAGATARDFYSYLQRKEARAIFVKYGFVAPAP